ncbi:MAG TPA: leucine-rich repeat domain-containing protein [Candidatus Blautia faecavium]|uniref:Leucine-rich repeat domain-containing protein n=1 Tax=Candidatus Blautia faecavium TaxID=2838487 RepID=A0A9D2RVF9_9FIRM|nr:leucine-rich repeat domain-containing protein [Candidatus Blautia faecavium]
MIVSCEASLTPPENNQYLLYIIDSHPTDNIDGVSYYVLLGKQDGKIWEETCIISYDDTKESINLSNWAHVIWRRAFEGSENLKEVNLDTGDLVQIAEKAFSGCTNLERVIIPDTVQEIADNAFENCPKLTLYVTEGSYAEQYAIEHQIPYEYTPTAPEIEKITVNKNMVTIQFSEFTGDMYYCVLGTGKTDDGVPVRSGNSGRIAVSQTDNQVTFRNVAQGNYYIGARALSLDGDAKVYSKWSGLGEAEITVTTPERPSILSITQSGNRLRVVPSIPDGADGYIVTVGCGTTKNDSSTAAAAVPSQKAGSRTVSGTGAVTLRNAKPGTYYIGIQTFIRSSDGSKTYSQWSPLKRFTVK